LLRLVTTFYLNKKLKQQAINLNNQQQYRYGCDIKVKPEPMQAKTKPDKIPSFTKRLESATPKTQSYYESIVDFCQKHNIKKTVYRNKVKFYVKSKTIANLYFTHKTLRICLALDPSKFDAEKFKFRDFSNYIKHIDTPMAVLLNSQKSVENCKILIYKALYEV